jgi:hypothetical protein
MAKPSRGPTSRTHPTRFRFLEVEGLHPAGSLEPQLIATRSSQTQRLTTKDELRTVLRAPRFQFVPFFKFIKMSRRIPLVQHEINDDTGDRNIEPNRDCQSAHPTVTIEARAQGWDHRNNHQRQNRERQEEMRNQQDIVERSHPTLGGEFHRSFADGAEQAKVISQITGQKDCRTDKGRDHASNVHPFPVSKNGSPSNCDEARTETVQGRVHRREIKDIHVRRELQKRTSR